MPYTPIQIEGMAAWAKGGDFNDVCPYPQFSANREDFAFGWELAAADGEPA